MNLFFLNPLWTVAALAAVPLVAHLFSRARPRRRDFPSLRLLREALRRVTRIRRPRDRWLLLLRTLAMAALVLAFLQPWLMSRFTADNGAAKTTVLMVDVTASMAYVEGTRSRLAQAASAAEEVLGSLPANSKANVVWVKAHAESVLPEPGPNLDYLRGALRQATARPERGDNGGALALALKQLADATGERELVVISDFQESTWKGADLGTPPGIRLTRIAVGQGDAPNIALAGLAVEPARPVAGQEARIVCRVRNFSAEPRSVTVFAEAGESRLSQTVEVAAWSETLAVMPVTFTTEGLVPLKASMAGEDRFPGDDVRYGLAEVRGALQVGVAGSADNATARVWARAAAALDGVVVRRLTLEQLDQPEQFDVLLIAGWTGRATPALTAHVKRGGALVIQPAEGLDVAPLRALLAVPPGPAGESLAVQVRDAPGWGLHIMNEDHPVFALFSGGAYGDPASAQFQRRIATPSFFKAKPLLDFDDNQPALALLDFPGKGTSVIAWWNLDLGASDWPSRTVFIPFFGELLQYLAQRADHPETRSLEPGDPLRLEIVPSVDPADVRLLDEHDQAISVGRESPQSPATLVSETPAVPGSYRWVAQGGILDRAIVNFPEEESDLRRMTEAELRQAAGAVISNAARAHIGELREGQPLWPWCLGAAALFLLAEGLCLWRFPGGTREKTGANPKITPASRQISRQEQIG